MLHVLLIYLLILLFYCKTVYHCFIVARVVNLFNNTVALLYHCCNVARVVNIFNNTACCFIVKLCIIVSLLHICACCYA